MIQQKSMSLDIEPERYQMLEEVFLQMQTEQAISGQKDLCAMEANSISTMYAGLLWATPDSLRPAVRYTVTPGQRQSPRGQVRASVSQLLQSLAQA